MVRRRVCIGDTIPLGPRVLFTRSPTAMAPTKEDYELLHGG